MPKWYQLIVLLFIGARPLLRRFETIYERKGSLSEGSLALMLLLALNFSLGHRIAGCPFSLLSPLAVLLPLFFAYSGLRTHIGTSSGQWLLCGLLIAAGE